MSERLAEIEARVKTGFTMELGAHAREDIPWLLEREKKLREALRVVPEPWKLERIAAVLDFFDRIVELADGLLPGEAENYRAVAQKCRTIFASLPKPSQTVERRARRRGER